MLQHVGQAGRDTVVDGGELHGYRVIPFVALGLACLAESLDASVIHDEMEVAELLVDLREQLRPTVSLGHVVPDREHTRIAGLEQR